MNTEYPGMMKIPMRAVPKARPKVGNKRAYMPAEYMAAKAEFATHLTSLRIPLNNHEGPVALEVVFGPDDIWMQLVPMYGNKPKGMRKADLDNLVGFVMDAAQDAGLIKDDKQVLSIEATYTQEGEG